MAENLFGGGGDIGVLLRSHDWSQTPLGAMETWPDSLITAVKILLAELERAKPPNKVQLDSEITPERTISTSVVLRQAAQAIAFRFRLTEALRPLVVTPAC